MWGQAHSCACRGEPYLASVGPDLELLEQYPLIARRTQGIALAQDPFLCCLTPSGVPLEPTSRVELRSGRRQCTEALRLRLAIKLLYAAQRRPQSPSMHLTRFVRTPAPPVRTAPMDQPGSEGDARRPRPGSQQQDVCSPGTPAVQVPSALPEGASAGFDASEAELFALLSVASHHAQPICTPALHALEGTASAVGMPQAGAAATVLPVTNGQAEDDGFSPVPDQVRFVRFGACKRHMLILVDFLKDMQHLQRCLSFKHTAATACTIPLAIATIGTTHGRVLRLRRYMQALATGQQAAGVDCIPQPPSVTVTILPVQHVQVHLSLRPRTHVPAALDGVFVRSACDVIDMMLDELLAELEAERALPAAMHPTAALAVTADVTLQVVDLAKLRLRFNGVHPQRADGESVLSLPCWSAASAETCTAMHPGAAHGSGSAYSFCAAAGQLHISTSNNAEGSHTPAHARVSVALTEAELYTEDTTTGRRPLAAIGPDGLSAQAPLSSTAAEPQLVSVMVPSQLSLAVDGMLQELLQAL